MLVLLDEADCPVARPVRPWDRLLARLRASRLDRDLADRASPDATVALALRAPPGPGAPSGSWRRRRRRPQPTARERGLPGGFGCRSAGTGSATPPRSSRT